MLELYKYIFTDFLTFFGTILILLIISGTGKRWWDAIIKLIRETNKIK